MLKQVRLRHHIGIHAQELLACTSVNVSDFSGQFRRDGQCHLRPKRAQVLGYVKRHAHLLLTQFKTKQGRGSLWVYPFDLAVAVLIYAAVTDN